jgi:hypothetical protein
MSNVRQLMEDSLSSDKEILVSSSGYNCGEINPTTVC